MNCLLKILTNLKFKYQLVTKLLTKLYIIGNPKNITFII